MAKNKAYNNNENVWHVLQCRSVRVEIYDILSENGLGTARAEHHTKSA